MPNLSPSKQALRQEKENLMSYPKARLLAAAREMRLESGGIELKSTSTAEVSIWNVLLYIFFGYITRQPVKNQTPKPITSRYLSYDKTGNKNVQLVLQHCCKNSGVARFTTHKSKLPFNKSGCCKTRNIAIQLGDVTLDDSQRRFLVQHSVAMLEQCCSHSKQCGNNVATLCCPKNRRCESPRVTSPSQQFCKTSCTILLPVLPYTLRWCCTGRFARTIFTATQRCNVGTMW